MTVAKPFLKWAGGKLRLAEQIAAHITPTAGANYFEPFLGGASVFFRIQPKIAVLSDENEALINAYRSVRANPKAVFESLSRLAESHNEKHYYLVRDEFNDNVGTRIAQAARFIYLNKAGFNGIYRVNQNGRYNVPHGNRENLALPSLDELLSISDALRGAALLHSDFELAVGHAKRNDIIYLDPPYPALNGTSFFNHYTATRFSSTEQLRVAKVAHDLHHRGCNIIVSNADTPEIRAMYKGWSMVGVELRRWITAAKTKHFVKELIVLSPPH
jgi:DNA adenine methylase